MARMTRGEMIEKLASVEIGTKVQWQGKTYTVLGVKDCGGKLARRDMGWLEEGKPETYTVEGKYRAAGQVFERSNLVFRSLMARPMDLDFEVIA